MAAHRHGTGKIAESYTSWSAGTRERELGLAQALETSKPIPNKATPPISQIVLHQDNYGNLSYSNHHSASTEAGQKTVN